jgi:hypothetical protein
MKKNPVMFYVAILFLMIIAAAFIYNNISHLYPRTSASSGTPSEFKYPGPPAFSVEIPNTFRKETPKAKEGQILNGKTASGAVVTLSVFNIPKDISMEDNGPKTFRPRLAGVKNLKIDDIKMISNEKFELDDGTPAWKCEMKWPSRGSTMVTTYLITADKDGKRVTIAAHSLADPAEVLKILKSLTFK